MSARAAGAAIKILVAVLFQDFDQPADQPPLVSLPQFLAVRVNDAGKCLASRQPLLAMERHGVHVARHERAAFLIQQLQQHFVRQRRPICFKWFTSAPTPKSESRSLLAQPDAKFFDSIKAAKDV
jgi:hypothetical protein